MGRASRGGSRGGAMLGCVNEWWGQWCEVSCKDRQCGRPHRGRLRREGGSDTLLRLSFMVVLGGTTEDF